MSRVATINAVVKFAAKTDLGRVRDNNEDKFDFFEPEEPGVQATKGSLYAVADGMGGHSAGQIACELALKTLIRFYYSVATSDVADGLRRAVVEANNLIWDTSQIIRERSGMGTTLTAVVVREDSMTVAQVGDSRAYLIRGGEISQITHDHSWVAEQVRLGSMTEDEALGSPFRNILTRSLGTAPTVEPDISAHQLQALDTIVLCSDGLSGHLAPSDILRICDKASPSAAATQLIEEANDRGGKDNITALILNIRALSPVELETSEQTSAVSSQQTTSAKSTNCEESKERGRRWGRRRA